MVIRLEPEAYGSVRSLYEPLRCNLVVDSMIDGNTPAWVFVDRKEDPQSALMWNRQDAMLIAGEAGNPIFNREIAEVVKAQIVPDARRRYIPELSLHYDSTAWLIHKDLFLGSWAYEIAGRRCYRFDRLRVDWRGGIPTGYEMWPIDQPVLRNERLENIQHVAGWVRSFWRSYADFVQTSFGACLVDKTAPDAPVVTSWCLGVYVSGSDYELGLFTMPDYRRQGQATLVSAAAIERCLQVKGRPHWHCWDDNRGSIAVAERVGFVDPTRYEVLRINI
ncbi:MAG: GNAT family N-acetyltransferase [Anaerolineae bacterium]